MIFKKIFYFLFLLLFISCETTYKRTSLCNEVKGIYIEFDETFNSTFGRKEIIFGSNIIADKNEYDGCYSKIDDHVTTDCERRTRLYPYKLQGKWEFTQKAVYSHDELHALSLLFIGLKQNETIVYFSFPDIQNALKSKRIRFKEFTENEYLKHVCSFARKYKLSKDIMPSK